MKKFLLTITIIFLCVVFCGCSNDETPPISRERTTLILRLFESMKKNDRATTIARAEKLQKLAPSNTYINYILETQTANIYIIHAQKALNNHDEKLALEILAQGLNKHPMNQIMQREYDNLKLLLDTENAIKKGELKSIPANLKNIPVYGPRLTRKMQQKNIPAEKN